ncbi:MAG: Lrp/AsnC family transcriptional regulator [Candidatus Bathyarchaeia archaeon]
MSDLDDKDIKILNVLQENAKMSFTEISKRLGIPESTVRYRVEQMERKNVITGYAALVNPRRVGLPITAVMLIKIYPQELREASEKLSRFNELRHLFKTTGIYDMISVVNARDISHLNRLMDRVKEVEGVKEVVVDVATELIKVNPKISLTEQDIR